MSELPKAYDAKLVDAKWYSFWQDGNFFTADPASTKPPFCIGMPPPNVTGALHMGHALVSTLQDIVIRHKRMQGYEVLWVPGTDHAGIATQTVVERHLINTQGKRRQDFSREEFLAHVWQWKETNAERILSQLKSVGCSCDWSRLRFTMDSGNNRAVRTVFKKLFDAGLIYRGDYLVNWDPITQTALADDEVEYEEKNGFLWHFRYPLADESGFITIATTRPETLLGDTAIAVSSKDERYCHLIGKMVILPLMERKIPIIADHLVDASFGSGAVKVTPAHDPNDYQIGLRHGLEFINIMTPDGRINGNGGRFQGMAMKEARDAVVCAMQELGLVEKIEPHTHRVGLSYRSKAVIEPYMSKQWFVRMSAFSAKLKSAVEEGRTELIPAHWKNTYTHWIDNLRDWCISRQLWWGHRIPIWYHRQDPERLLCSGEDAPPAEVQQDPGSWVQDGDVLDTWFSSALWPFAMLGWPEKTEELQRFYPNALLITGHDILFFWVARMLLMGEFAMGCLPFPKVFLHGLIYGKSYWRQLEQGQIAYLSAEERRAYDLGQPLPKEIHTKWEKMSKSKGNIIDPIEIIADYGTDAMRMALCASASQTREIDLDRRRFEEFKNFANKMWNGARFVLMNLEGDAPLSMAAWQEGLDETLLGLEDRWIIAKLSKTVQSVEQKLGQYLFDQAALEAYDFFWKEFCAYYVELAKPVLFGKSGSPKERQNKQRLLLIVLCQAIRLIHPMAPFITEELFQLLKSRFDSGSVVSGDIDAYTKEAIEALKAPACIVAPYPAVIKASDIDEEIIADFGLVEKAVYVIRNMRGEMKLPPGMATDLHLTGSLDDDDLKTLAKHRHLIAALVKVHEIKIHNIKPAMASASESMLNAITLSIPLPKELLAQEQLRLAKEQERLQHQVEKSRAQLSNEDFLKNAPPALVDKMRNQLQQAEAEWQQVCHKLGEMQQTAP